MLLQRNVFFVTLLTSQTSPEVLSMTVKKNHRIKRVRRSVKHKKWQVQEAKAKFSELLKETMVSGYQTITKNGQTVAYLISKEEFDQRPSSKRSILDALDRSPYPEIELDVERSLDLIREVDL